MKSIIVKTMLILPAILLVDYIIMALLGCTSCLFRMDASFNCGLFCIVGKVLIGLSLVFFFFMILPDIRRMRQAG